MKRILGIDPGLADTGVGIIEINNSKYTHIYHASIRTAADLSPGDRLAAIYDAIVEVIHTYNPDGAGIECLYFARNSTSALPVAQARGVILLAMQQHSVAAAEYTPQAIKQAMVGYGRAEKQQVQQMVKMVLGLTEIPRPDHAADALAAAICHANTTGFFSRIPAQGSL
ncbi:MAG: crossover junction endodeoxyribonuclease RuvC [Spirochaeta sp.]